MNNYSSFNDSVQQYPDRIAIETPHESVTYQMLDSQVNSISEILLKNGVTGGDIVGVYMQASAHYIATILAVNRIGATFMPLEANTPVKRLIKMLSKVTPCLIITSVALPEALQTELSKQDFAIPFAVLSGSKESPGIVFSDFHCSGKKSVASIMEHGLTSCYLIYTSGSTGNPKAIEGSVEGLDHFIKWEIAEFEIDQNVRVPLLAPLTFDVSLRDIFLPLYAGGTIVIPRNDIKHQITDFINWLSDQAITLVHMVPSLFRLVTKELKQKPQLDFSALRYILLAGEPLFYADVVNWREVMPQTGLVNLYGPSETSLAKVFFRIDAVIGKDRDIVPLGLPIPGVKLSAMKNGNVCKPGEIGELYIKTPYRSKGYYGADEMNSEMFVLADKSDEYGEISYKTGDFVKILSDGIVQFIGRQDNQVKINGNRVEISEVEGALNAYPPIEQAVVNVFTDSTQENQLIGYYSSAESIDTEKVKEHLLEILPVYMLPAYFIKIDKFSLNYNGKIDRRVLPLPSRHNKEANYEPCVGDVEISIEKIWKEILKVDQVGRNTSFFSIGGSSLKAIQIISRIQKEFNVLIKLGTFFAKPMIKDLASIVEHALVQL